MNLKHLINQMNKNITVLGAGCWGVTLAILLTEKKHSVTLWEISKERSVLLAKQREIEFLPGLRMPSSINICSDLPKSVENSDIIIFATPSQFIRETSKKLAGLKINENAILVNVSKGLEPGTFITMSEIIAEELPALKKRICALSGPSFAIEVAIKMPTAVVIAGKNPELTKTLQNIFSTPFFRVYTNTDIKGAELGGALKNIIAIAAGISDGIGYGDNAKATIITRGLLELIRMGEKLGAETNTFLGLSGLGDLTATCFSKHSRNRKFGENIGKGMEAQKALKEIKTVVEGYRSTNSAYFLGKKLNIELPIINELYHILYENMPVKNAISNLMLRGLKSEN